MPSPSPENVNNDEKRSIIKRALKEFSPTAVKRQQSSNNNGNDLSDVTGLTPQLGSTKYDSIYTTTSHNNYHSPSSSSSSALRHSTGRGAYTPFFPGQYEETLLSSATGVGKNKHLASMDDDDDNENNTTPFAPKKNNLTLNFESRKRQEQAKKYATHQLGVLRNELLIQQAKEEMKKFPMLKGRSNKQDEDFHNHNHDTTLTNSHRKNVFEDADETKKRLLEQKIKVHSRLRNASNNRSPPHLQTMLGGGSPKNKLDLQKTKTTTTNEEASITSLADTTTKGGIASDDIDENQTIVAAAGGGEVEETKTKDPDLENDDDENQQDQNSQTAPKSVMSFEEEEEESKKKKAIPEKATTTSTAIAPDNEKEEAPQQQQQLVQSSSPSPPPKSLLPHRFRPPSSRQLIDLSAPPPPPPSSSSPKKKVSNNQQQQQQLELPPTSPRQQQQPSSTTLNHEKKQQHHQKQKLLLAAAAHEEKAQRVASHQMEALRSWVSRSASRAKWIRDGISRLNGSHRLASVMEEPPIVTIVEFERTVETPRRELKLMQQRKQPLNVVEGNGDEVDSVIKNLLETEAQNRKTRERRMREEREKRAEEALQRRLALQKAKMEAEREEEEKMLA